MVSRSSNPTHSPPPKGASNGRRWEEVLDAATEVFEEKGYQAATLQDVASRLEMLAPSLYYYIRTKEDLLFAVMKRAHNLGLELITEPADLTGAGADERLAAFIRRWMGGTYPPQVRVVERDLRFLSPERQKEVMAWRRRINGFVQDLVRTGIEEGRFRPDVSPRVVANTLFVVLNSVPAWYREGRELPYPDLAVWYVHLFLAGLQPLTS
jgi:AcrR family transcriptional regulator